MCTQQSLGGSDTHGQELATMFLVKLKVSISLQHQNELGQTGNQALRTGILERSPSQKECLLYR